MCTSVLKLDNHETIEIEKLITGRISEYLNIVVNPECENWDIPFGRTALSNITSKEITDAFKCLHFAEHYTSVFKIFPELFNKYRIII